MHFLDHLMNVLRANPQKDAVIWRGRAFRYAWLCEAVSRWDSLLEESGVKPGSAVSVEADFSPDAIGLLLALVRRSCTIWCPCCKNSPSRARRCGPLRFCCSTTSAGSTRCSTAFRTRAA